MTSSSPPLGASGASPAGAPPGAGAPSLVEVLEAERTAAAAAMRSHPLVKAAFDAFPDAELIEEGGAPPERREIPWSRKA